MYTERQLVDFGNYLFKRYNVQVFSNDGTNTPLYDRQVHHADTSNWKTTQKVDRSTMLAVGAEVYVQFGKDDVEKLARVKTVHLYENAVKYDLELLFPSGNNKRIYNIEAEFVTDGTSTPSQLEPVEAH